MREIVLARHGATEYNESGQFLSRTDVPLSRLGRVQAERLKTALQAFGFERCFDSPMRRALETAEIAAPGIPCEVDAALREVDFGAWEGKTLDWLETNDPQGLAARRRDPVRFRPPEGESFGDVADRLLRGLPIESEAVTALEPGEFAVV